MRVTDSESYVKVARVSKVYRRGAADAARSLRTSRLSMIGLRFTRRRNPRHRGFRAFAKDRDARTGIPVTPLFWPTY
jgi:hypothetical protein